MSAGRTVTSNSVDWNTPPHYVEAVRQVLGDIELDPCTNEWSYVNASKNIILPDDGLKADWNYRTIFVNPPYGRDPVRGTRILDWVRKTAEAHRDFGSEAIMLIPVATNTRHFKEIIFKDAETICFLADTRLRFHLDGKIHEKGAPMACCMVYFGKSPQRFRDVFSQHGTVLKIKCPNLLEKPHAERNLFGAGLIPLVTP